MERDMIIEEYKKAEIHFKAMAALVKNEGISIDGAAKEKVVQQTTPKQEEQPQTTAPGIVYIGKNEYTISPGEHVKFSVYFNGVSTTSDYRILPGGTPTYIKSVITGNKTNSGFRADFDIQGVRAGQGSVKMYIKSDPENTLNIIFNVK